MAAPITVSYNLPSISKLDLSAATLAGIFSGAIKTWNAPAIVADNPGVSLAEHGDHAGAPLRWLGHDQQLHLVSEDGGPVGLDPGYRNHGQLAWWAGGVG